MTLPDCMMPDGADPCKGYQELRSELDRLRAEVERLEERLAPCANWLRYAYRNVDSATADHVKAWLAREPALASTLPDPPKETA